MEERLFTYQDPFARTSLEVTALSREYTPRQLVGVSMWKDTEVTGAIMDRETVRGLIRALVEWEEQQEDGL